MHTSLTLIPIHPIASRKNPITYSFMIDSSLSITVAMIWSAIKLKMSDPLHCVTSFGSESIHEGFIMSITWHAHATGLTQMAARRSAVRMSVCNALTTSTMTVPMLVGQGGLQRAHAKGAGRPPSRAANPKNSHLRWQSTMSEHLTAWVVLPLTCDSWTSVRG